MDLRRGMRFCFEALAGRIQTMLAMGESPMAVTNPPGAATRIMHCHAVIDGRPLMASDRYWARPLWACMASR
jgi:uncharacterized glyoxalase superfamily protein PhnB